MNRTSGIKSGGLRNVAIRGYFAVDLEIIWVTIKEQLSELKEIVSRMKEN